MAKIISQENIFDYNKIEELGDLERLSLCLNGINDEKLANILKKERKNGRNDYPIEVMLNLIYAMKIFSHPSVESFRRELSRNNQLRKACGLGYRLNRKHLVPPARVFTNILKKLEKHVELLDEIFESLVSDMYDKVDGFGEMTAGDGKIVQSCAKKKAEIDYKDGRIETDAEWTTKTYNYTDATGKKHTKKNHYFGFKLHILCDVKTELPIKINVTPANKSEKNEMMKLLNDLTDYQKEILSYLLLDKGYDCIYLHEKAIEIGAKPIIDICNKWKDGERTRQYKDTDIVYDYKGNVYYINDRLEEIPMVYMGYDRNRDALRYKYENKIYRILRKEDERIFTPIARNSKKFKRIYKGRTAVERLNGRLDRDYQFENHYIRGLAKMKTMVMLSAIIMLSMAKAHIRQKQTNYASLYNVV